MIWTKILFLILLLLSSEIMATVFRGLCQEIRLDYCGNQFLKTTCQGDVADLRPLDFYFHYPYIRDYQVLEYCYAFRPRQVLHPLLGGCLGNPAKELKFNTSLYTFKIDSNLPVVKNYHKCTPEKDFITVFYYPNTGQLVWTCLDDRHSRDGPQGALIVIVAIKVSSAGDALEARTEVLSEIDVEELTSEVTYWHTKISDMFCMERMPAACETFLCRFDIPSPLESKPYFRTYIVVGIILIVLLLIFLRISRMSFNRVASLASVE